MGKSIFNALGIAAAAAVLFAGCDYTPVDDRAKYILTTDCTPSGGGTVTRYPDNKVYSDSQEVVVTAVPQKGYEFVRWKGSLSSTEDVVTITMDKEKTLTAVFQKTEAPTPPQTVYPVAFNASGGTVSPTSATTGADGKLASLPKPERKDYTFKGWFTAATGGDSVTVSRVYGANATIYARWETGSSPPDSATSPKNAYTVTFNYNYSGGANTADTTGADGKLASLPKPARKDYTFKGWFTAATGGDSVTVGRVYGANATVYARWEAEPPAKPIVTTFTDDRDKKVYNKVVIGTQTWMAENLNYDVPDDTTDVCYNNNADSCAKYGRLYDWDAATAACPVGWHLPSDAEWTALTYYVGGAATAGTKLKSKTGWYNFNGAPNDAGTDDYGFSALPGGYGNGSGFHEAGSYGGWGSATEGGAKLAWYRRMYFYLDYLYRYYNDKPNLSSVRCVQD
jgi:uncharacterized protein (TIGR02145 family)/uncharacterized repeat protein (TIGR02543 family)